MARPQMMIDRKDFEKLCGLMCTLEEIAWFFKCSEDTVERWCLREYKESFADVYPKLTAYGRISLRRMMWKLAEKNARVCIFLAKNYLGMKEEPKEITVNGQGMLLELINGLHEPVPAEEADGVEE